MYIFNKITVNPQLPKRIERIGDIANNLWWAWNTEFLKLFKEIDRDLWESVDKNPTKYEVSDRMLLESADLSYTEEKIWLFNKDKKVKDISYKFKDYYANNS